VPISISDIWRNDLSFEAIINIRRIREGRKFIIILIGKTALSDA
jgi:hypothetical protein